MIDGAGAGRYRGVRAPPPLGIPRSGLVAFFVRSIFKKADKYDGFAALPQKMFGKQIRCPVLSPTNVRYSRNLRVCLFVYGRGGRGPTAGRKLEILNYIWCPNITRCHGSVAAVAGVGGVECVCNDSIKTNICSEN